MISLRKWKEEIQKMNRYDHALNKKLEEIHKESDKIHCFGFNTEIEDIESKFLKRRKKYPYFYLKPKETARAGIIFKDYKKVFASTFVHWHNKRYFLCKSIQKDSDGKGMRAICCEKLKYRNFRVACIIILYEEMQHSVMYPIDYKIYKIVPWCFGKTVYQKLNNMNKQFPIHSHDFIIKRTNDRLPVYDIQACTTSFWQKFNNKEEIITEAERFRENIKEILGEDLSIEEIRDLLINVK